VFLPQWSGGPPPSPPRTLHTPPPPPILAGANPRELKPSWTTRRIMLQRSIEAVSSEPAHRIDIKI
jgi:hypothetical protein